MKQLNPKLSNIISIAATFGWLCVETRKRWRLKGLIFAATFGWLCVETPTTQQLKPQRVAATFGWLCVETLREK